MNVHSGSLTPGGLLSIPAPTTVRGRATKLGVSVNGESIAYGSGRTAVIRSLRDEGEGQLFGGHAANVNVVKILSPYYAASGDSAGHLKVWDTTSPSPSQSQSIKFESKPLSTIADLSCDGEGKRLVCVGEGRAAFGASFNLDTGGASIGQIEGHSKAVNGVAVRTMRPFKAVTGGDDFAVVQMNGVPFKYNSTSRRHTRFVQGVDYAPSGALFASCGSDGQVFLYDGLTFEDKGALLDHDDAGASAAAAHKAGVFAATFSRDSRSVGTSSADGKAKVWDVESGKVVKTWDFDEGDTLQQQQVGNVWAGSSLVSLSFSGNLTVLDPRSSTPVKTLYGHQNPITALAYDGASETFFSGDSAGRVLATGAGGAGAKKEAGKLAGTEPVKGDGHKGLVVALVKEGESVYSAGYDDSLKRLNPSSGFDSSSLPTGGQPKGLAAGGSTTYLATASSLLVLSSGSKVATLPLPSSALCLAASPDGGFVAVGTEDLKTLVYDAREPKDLKLLGTIETRAQASALAFSGDGKYLAIGLATGKIPLYNVSTLAMIHSRWTDTTARIHSLAFNAASTHLAAASLDESIRIYSVTSPSQVIAAKNAHRGGVSSLVWNGDAQLVSAGADGALRTFDVKLA